MSDSDSTNDPSWPIFEVHRVGVLESSRADSLSLAEIAKTYSELIPITSLEQFKKSTALATVPAPGHMIVDKHKFKDLVAKHASDIAAARTEETIKRMEESIGAAQKELVAEVTSTLSLISATLQTEQNALKENLNAVWEASQSNSSDDLDKKKKALESALAAHQATLEKIFDLVIAKRSSIQHYEFGSNTNQEDE